jgi:hypothetical protein
VDLLLLEYLPEIVMKFWVKLPKRVVFNLVEGFNKKNKLFFYFSASSLFMDSQFFKKERKRIEFIRYLYRLSSFIWFHSPDLDFLLYFNLHSLLFWKILLKKLKQFLTLLIILLFCSLLLISKNGYELFLQRLFIKEN